MIRTKKENGKNEGDELNENVDVNGFESKPCITTKYDSKKTTSVTIRLLCDNCGSVVKSRVGSCSNCGLLILEVKDESI